MVRRSPAPPAPRSITPSTSAYTSFIALRGDNVKCHQPLFQMLDQLSGPQFSTHRPGGAGENLLEECQPQKETRDKTELPQAWQSNGR